jgi:hypothetical protein
MRCSRGCPAYSSIVDIWFALHGVSELLRFRLTAASST